MAECTDIDRSLHCWRQALPAISPSHRSEYIVLRLAIVLGLLMLCLSDCPEEWKSYKDFCLRLTVDRSPTFDLAERSCRKLHPSAHLVSMHSMDENIVAADTALNQTVWIGLKQVKERWRWTDRTFVDFTNWSPQKGDNSTCAQMGGDQKWRNQRGCGNDKKTKNKGGKKGGGHRKKPSKVKRKAPVPMRGKRGKGKGKGLPALCKVPHMETCGGPDWIRAGEFCYNFSSPLDMKSWHEASADCLQMDARFVAIFNARQNDVLRRLAHLTSSNVWLGLIHTDDGFHRWADGAIMTYENFGPHDHYDADHKCVFMDELTGLWQHEQCTSLMEFVCMRPKLQLYDARSANDSKPRATVEIWRRIEEALVPARAPPTTKKPKTTTTPKPKLPSPEFRTVLREEVDEGPEKISAGLATDSRGAGQRGRRSSRTGCGTGTEGHSSGQRARRPALRVCRSGMPARRSTRGGHWPGLRTRRSTYNGRRSRPSGRRSVQKFIRLSRESLAPGSRAHRPIQKSP